MNLKRPNKALEKQIKQEVKGLFCPIHQKAAEISMDDEKEPVKVTACCVFFKNDVMVIAERMRKDFIYIDEKTRERLEKERLKAKFNP
ncbi:MAG: hypothetical protein WCR21_02955 [Bacteroidota bacterium]